MNKKILRFLIPISLLMFWFFSTHFGLIKPLYLPKPIKVFEALFDIKNNIFKHILASSIRLIFGYILGIFTGIYIGLKMRASKNVENLLYNTIESWRPIPPVALVPFFILWFQFSTFGKIFLVSLGVALIMIVTTYEAAGNVKPIYLKAAYSLGASNKKVFKSVVLPALIPELTSGLRISIAVGFGLVVVSELMGAKYGLGYLINISRVTFSTHTIFLCIIIIGLISVIFDKIIQFVTNKLTRWSQKSFDAIS